jgi:hypothetical protein
MLSIVESLQKNVSKKASITKVRKLWFTVDNFVDHFPQFFWAKMAPTREIYKRLTECLEAYVEQSRAIYDDTD